MRHNARMPGSRVRTATYTEAQRARLGDAAFEAREALGLSRPAMVEAAAARGIRLNKKSIELIETGQPGVGPKFLYALGSFIPNWTRETPQTILEGGPIPPVVRTLPPPSAAPAEPYEFSAEARARMINMTIREVLAFVEHELLSRGEAAAERAFDEIARVRREARQIQARD